jgi:microcystin-dependent protein
VAVQDEKTPVGITMGALTATLTIDQLPSHTHLGTISANGEHDHVLTEGVGEDVAVVVDEGSTTKTAWIRRGTTTSSTSTAHSHTHEMTIQSMGSGQPVSLVQPTLVIGGAMIYAGA